MLETVNQWLCKRSLSAKTEQRLFRKHKLDTWGYCSKVSRHFSGPHRKVESKRQCVDMNTKAETVHYSKITLSYYGVNLITTDSWVDVRVIWSLYIKGDEEVQYFACWSRDQWNNVCKGRCKYWLVCPLSVCLHMIHVLLLLLLFIIDLIIVVWIKLRHVRWKKKVRILNVSACPCLNPLKINFFPLSGTV